MDYADFLTPTIGATGLLALVVIMVLRGSLVPRSYLDDLRHDRDEQIRIWREAYEHSQKAQDTQRDQITALLESARTTTHVLQALPEAAGLDSRRKPRAVSAQED
jgi:hypothetical protein